MSNCCIRRTNNCITNKATSQSSLNTSTCASYSLLHTHTHKGTLFVTSALHLRENGAHYLLSPSQMEWHFEDHRLYGAYEFETKQPCTWEPTGNLNERYAWGDGKCWGRTPNTGLNKHWSEHEHCTDITFFSRYLHTSGYNTRTATLTLTSVRINAALDTVCVISHSAFVQLSPTSLDAQTCLKVYSIISLACWVSPLLNFTLSPQLDNSESVRTKPLQREVQWKKKVVGCFMLY